MEVRRLAVSGEGGGRVVGDNLTQCINLEWDQYGIRKAPLQMRMAAFEQNRDDEGARPYMETIELPFVEFCRVRVFKSRILRLFESSNRVFSTS